MIELLLFGLTPEVKLSPLLQKIQEPEIVLVETPPPEPTLEEVNDPNNCEPAMYWAEEAPYYCIPKPTQSRSESVLPASGTGTPISDRGSSTGNLYSSGNCTFYAKSKRPDLPNNLGNASTWVSRASSQGFATGKEPRANSVAQRGNHVVFVESVNSDGTFNLSEWNYRNLYETTYRTVSAVGWQFIY